MYHFIHKGNLRIYTKLITIWIIIKKLSNFSKIYNKY